MDWEMVRTFAFFKLMGMGRGEKFEYKNIDFSPEHQHRKP